MNKFTLTLAVLALFFLKTAAAHALTLDEVLIKMKGYQAQNAANPAVLGASTSVYGAPSEMKGKALLPEQSQVIINDLRNTTGTPVSEIVTKTVKYGMTNDAEVKKLQAVLIAKGFLDGEATGNFLTKTRDALKAFQASRGITGASADGTIVGPQTKRALSTAY